MDTLILFIYLFMCLFIDLLFIHIHTYSFIYSYIFIHDVMYVMMMMIRTFIHLSILSFYSSLYPDRPDVTSVVDWALKINYLNIYLYQVLCVFCMVYLCYSVARVLHCFLPNSLSHSLLVGWLG